MADSVTSCRALVCSGSGSPRGFRREAMGSQRRRDRGDQEVCQAETEAVSHGGEIIDPSEPPPLKVSCSHFSGAGVFSCRRCAAAHENLQRSDPAFKASHSTQKTSRISFCKKNETPSGGRSQGCTRSPRKHPTARPSHCRILPRCPMVWKIPSLQQSGRVLDQRWGRGMGIWGV